MTNPTTAKTTAPQPGGAKFKAALIQTRTGRDIDANLVATTALIRAAVKGGAAYVQTPEMTNIMELDRDRLLTWTKPDEGNPALAHYQALARELSIWLHLGSMAVRVGDTKLANRGYLISPKGAVVYQYMSLNPARHIEKTLAALKDWAKK